MVYSGAGALARARPLSRVSLSRCHPERRATEPWQGSAAKDPRTVWRHRETSRPYPHFPLFVILRRFSAEGPAFLRVLPMICD